MRTGSQAADGQVTPATFSFQKLALHCPPDSGPPGPGFTPLLSSSSLALLIFLVLFYPSLCLCCPHLVPLVHTLNHGTLSEVRVSTEESSSMKVVPLWGLSMKVKQRNGRPSRLVLEQRAVPILAALFISSAPQSKFLNLSSPRFHICQVARTGCIHRAVQRVKWVCICPGPAAMPAPPQVLSNDSYHSGRPALHLTHGPTGPWDRNARLCFPVVGGSPAATPWPHGQRKVPVLLPAQHCEATEAQVLQPTAHP